MEKLDIKNLPENFKITSPAKMVYEVKRKLGAGTFGTVYHVVCLQTNESFALKIGLRHKESYADQLRNESEVYKFIYNNQSVTDDDLQYFGRYIDSFSNDNFVVIILELYQSDIYNCLLIRQYKGFTLPEIQKILRDLASGIKILHNINLVHTDLKPENMMVTSDGHIKIIDFGSTVPSQAVLSGYLQSRYYRAPEVILKYQLTKAIDVWSFGCIAFELYIGLPLFYGLDNLNMLQLMQVRLGRFPQQMIRGSSCANEFFENGNVKGIDQVNDRLNFGCKNLQQLIFGRPTDDFDAVEYFYDLVSSCLTFDKDFRTKSKDIINHNFLTYDFS